MSWLTDTISSAYHGATHLAGEAYDTVAHSAPVEAITHSAPMQAIVNSAPAQMVAHAAADSYHATMALPDTISHGVTAAENGVTRGMHAAEDFVDHRSHDLARRVAGVPIVGGMARGVADEVTGMAQVTGGIVEGATSMAGGIVNMAAHPLAAAGGIEQMVEHAGVPLVSSVLRAGHDVIDGRSLSDIVHRQDPMNQGVAREDRQFWGNVVHGITDPYARSIHEGRYGEALGRGVFDIGSMFIGAGEAGAAAHGAEAAADAARAAELARGASALGDVEHAGQLAHGATAARDVEAATALAHDAAPTADVAHAAPAADVAHAPPTPAMRDRMAPEDVLRADGMPEDEIAHAREGMVHDAETTAHDVPPSVHLNPDGTPRAPMSLDEMDATTRAHDIMLRDVREGATARKVLPNRDIGNYLAGEYRAMRGDFNLARNTEGLNAEETIARDGLDYEHTPHAPDFAGARRGQFTDVDHAGNVTVADEVRRNRLHYIDMPMSEAQARAARVPVGEDLFNHAQAFSDNPERYTIRGRTPEPGFYGPDTPRTGTGMTATANMVDDAGRTLAPRVNQELVAGSHSLQPGAALRARGEIAGADQTIARYQAALDEHGVPRLGTDGAPIHEWQLEGGLTRDQRAMYQEMIDEARRAAAERARIAAERAAGGH